jgi:hypothetical protein
VVAQALADDQAPPPPPVGARVAAAGGGAQAAPAIEPEPEPDPEAEPEPASEPEPVPMTVGELTLDTAAKLWPAVVDTVKQGNAMLAALLADARAVAVGGQELTLAFPTGAAFLKRKAEQDDNRRLAAEAWRSVTGQPMSLKYELRDDVAAEPGAPALSGEQLVRRFMEEFDAEEISDGDPTEDPEPKA